MKRIIALLAFIPLSAHAQSASGDVLRALDTSANAPPLVYGSSGDLSLRPDGGFLTSSIRGLNVKLGSGVSLDVFSSLSTPQFNSLGNTLSLHPADNFSASPFNDIYGGRASEQPIANVGGRVAMDLGGGVSVNFVGDLTRVPASFAGPGAGLPWTPQAGTTGHVGAGLSFDLGGGSSLSLTGGVSSGRCVALSLGSCR